MEDEFDDNFDEDGGDFDDDDDFLDGYDSNDFDEQDMEYSGYADSDEVDQFMSVGKYKDKSYSNGVANREMLDFIMGVWFAEETEGPVVSETDEDFELAEDTVEQFNAGSKYEYVDDPYSYGYYGEYYGDTDSDDDSEGGFIEEDFSADEEGGEEDDFNEDDYDDEGDFVSDSFALEPNYGYTSGGLSGELEPVISIFYTNEFEENLGDSTSSAFARKYSGRVPNNADLDQRQQWGGELKFEKHKEDS